MYHSFSNLEVGDTKFGGLISHAIVGGIGFDVNLVDLGSILRAYNTTEECEIDMGNVF